MLADSFQHQDVNIPEIVAILITIV